MKIWVQNVRDLHQGRRKLSAVGSGAFPVVSPQTWNHLPEHVTSAGTSRRLFKCASS